MSLGHEVRLIAPKFVKPYVKNQKNDMADAEAIAEAASLFSDIEHDRSATSQTTTWGKRRSGVARP